MLTSIDYLFPFKLSSSWFLVWWVILNRTFWELCYETGAYLKFLFLSGFFWHCSGRKKGHAIYLLPDGGRSLGSPLASDDTTGAWSGRGCPYHQTGVKMKVLTLDLTSSDTNPMGKRRGDSFWCIRESRPFMNEGILCLLLVEHRFWNIYNLR